jgi:hydrogenase-4 component F
MILAMLLVPSLAGLIAFMIRPHGPRRALLLAPAVTHTVLVGLAWKYPPAPVTEGWLQLDAPGLLFLTMTSVLFLAASIYALGYLACEGEGHKTDFEEGFLFVNIREATFTGCLLFFLAAMTFVTVSQHLGLLWVGVEATTLVSAPLIHFHRHHRSLEATWKYLVICSVGIALALLGNFFLVIAASGPGPKPIPMVLASLVEQAARLDPLWLKAAFLLLLVGYGTKMGLAPMHTWLPDAHSESPSVVSALLSGVLLNGAFLAILRLHTICAAAGLAIYSQRLLLVLGLFSMTVAVVFIIGQVDFKRLLAYSSIEHMGILALGVGLGGVGYFGAFLHAINHSLTKAMLFLVAGNIIVVYKTKSTTEVTGLLRVLPFSGVFWVGGFLAICGSPPFGLFLSEFTILKAAFQQGHPLVAVGYLILLGATFVGMATVFLRMAQGARPQLLQTTVVRETFWSVFPPALLGAGVLLLGLYIPEALNSRICAAVSALGVP